MKKIFVYMASAALVFAASCNKIEEANTPVDTPAETELITVELNPQTKTSLDGMSTVWTAGDKVNVTVGEEVIGTLTLVSGSTFKGEITAGLEGGTSVTLNYPVDEDGKTVTTVPATQTAAAGSFAQGAALLEGTTTVADLRAGVAAKLTNKTALLKFSVAQAGDVTFEVGTTTYTVNGCETGSDYYVCINPVSDVNLVARIGGYLSNATTKTVNFAANKIANLGTLPAPVDSKWRLKGTFDWATGKTFYKDLNGYYVVKNISFDKTTEVKVHNQDGKDEWLRTAANVALADDWYKLGGYDGGNGNIIKGTYDVYVDPQGCNIHFRTAGEPLTEAIPATRTVTVYLNSTTYDYLWCWNKDKNSQNFTGGTWPGQISTTNVTINGKTYRKWVLKSCELGVYTNMIFSKNGNSQTGEDGSTGLLMGETMFVKLESGKTRFNNAI